MVMDAKGLQSALGSISEGRAIGLTIQDVRISRVGSRVYIDAVMADGGEPNLAAWKAGQKQIDELFADPAVAEYHVSARSKPATHILLTAPQVPSLGYRTFWIRPRLEEEKAPIRMRGSLVKALLPLARLPLFQALAPHQRNKRPPYRIENEFFVLEVAKDGTLTLQDKRGGQCLTGLNRFEDGGDCGDEYNYSAPASDRFVSPRLKCVTVEYGPIQQSLQLDLELPTPASLTPDRKSRSKETLFTRISSLVTLSSGIPRVDIRTTLSNHARDHRLRVHFHAPFTTRTGCQDGHFEVVERQIGLPAFDDTWIEQPRPEVPQRAFTDISDGSSGLMIANRGLPEVEVLKDPLGNAEIALTLLRCVGWLSRDDFSARKGHAGPFLETPAAQMPGEWAFDYSIIPHSGNWQSVFQHAYAFETPLRAITTGLHAGSLPPAGSFVETTPENFVVTAVKQTGDGRGWLVRGYNITGEAINVTLKPWRLFKNVELVDLAEENLSGLKLDETGCVSIPLSGHAILSVLFKT